MRETHSNSSPTINVPLVVLVLSLCGLLVVSQLYVSIPLIPLVSQVFEVSPIAASWLGSSFGFAYAFGFLVFGPLSDHYGRKRVLVPGLGALASITFAVGASPSFQVLLQLRVLQGFIAATFAPVALAYISENLPGTIRPIGIACMSTGFLLAGIVGQVYASTIGEIYGWRWVFWLLAIAYALAVFFIATQLPSGNGQKLNTSILSVYRNMAGLLSRLPLLAAYVAALMLLLSFVALYSGLGAYVQTRYGVDQSSLFLIRLAGIPGMLLSPLSSIFIQKWGNKTVVIGGLLLAAFGLALAALTTQLPILVLATGVFVAGISATVPALIALVSSLAVEARGAAVALYTFVLFVGASFGSLVDTLLRPVGFITMCLILAGSLLSAAAIVQVGVRGIKTSG